jgi:hypothetical protein
MKRTISSIKRTKEILDEVLRQKQTLSLILDAIKTDVEYIHGIRMNLKNRWHAR